MLTAALGLTVAWIGASPRPVPSLSALRTENPATTALIEIRRAESRAKGRPFRTRWSWTPLDRISPRLANAVIAAEDSTFARHKGIAWGLAWKAFLQSVRTGRKDRGASTLTQQVARNLYLSPRKTYTRKLREMLIAQRLEQRLSKRRILEIYLNIAEWGDGIFGAEAAARAYFGKPAAELTWEEAVALAAVLPSPRRHRPTNKTPWVSSREARVISRLIATGRTRPPLL